MKNFTVPFFSTDSLGNSLFECVTLDSTHPKAGRTTSEPRMIRAGVVCLCLRGRGTFVINDTQYNVEKGDMVTILSNTVVQVTYSSDDFIGYVIAASTKFLMNIQMSDVVQSYIYISSNPVLRVSDEQMNTIIELGEMLKRKRDKREHPFGEEISHHLLLVLCYELHAMYRDHIAAGDRGLAVDHSRQSVLCREFLVLVEKYACEYRDMGFYADKLCISTKYLSVVVKKASGQSPVEWIDRTVMRYARTLLTSSDMTVQQIAAKLNFPNPSFFGQYFKRHEGVTPKKFRNKNRS